MKKNTLLKVNVLIGIIIVLGFLITSFVNYYNNVKIMREDVKNVADLTAEIIYHKIDADFTKPINISLTMANDTLLKDFLMNENKNKRGNDKSYINTLKDYLYTYKKKYDYDSVFLVSVKTNKYYHYNGIDRILGKSNPENKWYYEFLNSKEEYSINIDNDEALNNEITVFINCRIKDKNNNNLGVVGVGFKVDNLQKLFRDYENKFGVKAYLINSKGDIQISTSNTGYENANLFEKEDFKSLKNKILIDKNDISSQSLWFEEKSKNSYIVNNYIKNLNWHLIIDNDTTKIQNSFRNQMMFGILTVTVVIILIILIITKIIRNYRDNIERLTIEKEKKHRTVFQTETAKIYENIYEIDITHNKSASEETDEYFESLGVPVNTPFNEALDIIAEKQIKEKYRSGYLNTFSPENVLKQYNNGIESLYYDFMTRENSEEVYHWVRITTRIFYWDDDKSIRMLVYRQNIDEEKSRESKLFEKMESDSLTGLYNKAATQNYIHDILSNSKNNKDYAFFIFDIDNFKNVNDTLGHAAGDKVIYDFANAIKDEFRDNDIIGRIGGDEFAAFIPCTDMDMVKKKAMSILESLSYEYTDDKGKVNISSSIGVSTTFESERDFESLYKNADKALYKTKENGKNGFTLYAEMK